MSSVSKVVTAAELLRAKAKRPAALATPAGAFERGSLIELCGARSSGRFSIALAALAQASYQGESAALVDCGDHLDPQAAKDAGVVLERLLWLRPRRLKEALLSAEMLLGSGFSLVVLDLGGKSPAGVPDAAWLRLPRASRARNSVLLLLSPRPCAGTAAHAVLRAGRGRAVWRRGGPPLLSGLDVRLRLERGRADAPARLSLPVR